MSIDAISAVAADQGRVDAAAQQLAVALAEDRPAAGANPSEVSQAQSAVAAARAALAQAEAQLQAAEAAQTTAPAPDPSSVAGPRHLVEIVT